MLKLISVQLLSLLLIVSVAQGMEDSDEDVDQVQSLMSDDDDIFFLSPRTEPRAVPKEIPNLPPELQNWQKEEADRIVREKRIRTYQTEWNTNISLLTNDYTSWQESAQGTMMHSALTKNDIEKIKWCWSKIEQIRSFPCNTVKEAAVSDTVEYLLNNRLAYDLTKSLITSESSALFIQSKLNTLLQTLQQSSDTIERILDCGIQPNAAVAEQATMQLNSVALNNSVLARLCLRLGADMNYQGAITGNTLLHRIACSTNNTPNLPMTLEICKLLLAHGADTNLKNSSGKIPLEIALDNSGASAIINLLLDHQDNGKTNVNNNSLNNNNNSVITKLNGSEAAEKDKPTYFNHHPKSPFATYATYIRRTSSGEQPADEKPTAASSDSLGHSSPPFITATLQFQNSCNTDDPTEFKALDPH